MLTNKQIEEIREHLELAQNPVFFFDNDADGLCSFLLLRRKIGRGKGVAVKSYPDLNAQYASKVFEFKADYVFILDKPLVSKSFFDEIQPLGIPVVWIDHHNVDKNISYDKLFYYNSFFDGEKKGEPVTCISYNVSGKKEDLWIAIMGCVADHYLPDFYKEFKEDFPNLAFKGEVKRVFDVYYLSEIGKIARLIGFGLKDSISNVVEMQNFLLNCRSPEDVVAESSGNKGFREKVLEISKKYNYLIEKAKDKDNFFGELIFFDYSGDLSISAEISNELSYYFNGKYIAIAYRKEGITNISLRGKGIRNILNSILPDFENSSGGGHEDAVGARIKTEDLARFREALEKKING